MFKFDKFMYGKKVRFINAEAYKESPECYPPVNSIGIIVQKRRLVHDNFTYVNWQVKDYNEDFYLCEEEFLELVEENS